MERLQRASDIPIFASLQQKFAWIKELNTLRFTGYSDHYLDSAGLPPWERLRQIIIAKHGAVIEKKLEPDMRAFIDQGSPRVCQMCSQLNVDLQAFEKEFQSLTFAVDARRPWDGNSPLHILVDWVLYPLPDTEASHQFTIAVMRMLLLGVGPKVGVVLADINAVNKYGQTPAMLATGRWHLFRELLQNHASLLDLRLHDDRGQNVLHYLAGSADDSDRAGGGTIESNYLRQKLELALAHPRCPSLSHPDRYGDTPFHLACLAANIQAIVFFLQYQEQLKTLDSVNALGQTPLTAACFGLYNAKLHKLRPTAPYFEAIEILIKMRPSDWGGLTIGTRSGPPGAREHKTPPKLKRHDLHRYRYKESAKDVIGNSWLDYVELVYEMEWYGEDRTRAEAILKFNNPSRASRECGCILS